MQATGVLEGRQARPWFGPPDALTALRLPLAVAFLVFDDTVARLAVVLVAGVSDFLDGIWARAAGGSRLGAILDPVCDKAFMAAGFFVVWRSHLLAPLEILGVLSRDAIAVLGFLPVAVFGRPTALPARAGGKAVTLCQLLTLTAFVAGSDLLRPLAWATAAVSMYAIADYGQAAWRRQSVSS